jgi:Skp family chaperone for outer membrane proteins
VIVPRTLILSAVLASALLPARAAWAAGPTPAPVSAEQRAAEVVAALKEYRASLETLMPLRERELAGANKLRAERREFLERGIISRKEFEETEAAVTRAEEKLEETRRAIVAADHAMAEATTARAVAGLSPLAPGGYEQSADLIRYNGPAAWSLTADTPKLRQFFAARFGRALPVSSYGQTPLHDRMGLDHRDALDVAVHPDSPEGRTLMDYLRAAGIPFIASWGAVPRSASGAHIHVGQPSPRISVKR